MLSVLFYIFIIKVVEFPQKKNTWKSAVTSELPNVKGPMCLRSSLSSNE